MVRETVHGDREDRVGKPLDHVTSLEIILAVPVRSQPPRSHIVYSIAGDKGIVISLGNFVAKRRHVLESATEQSGSDPAGVVHDVTLLEISVAGRPGFEIVRMESQNAAI